MKKLLLLTFALVATATFAFAQSATVTTPASNPTTGGYLSAGGNATFTANFAFTTPTSNPSVIALSVQLPAGWTFVSSSGASAAAGPSAGDSGLLEWAFSNFTVGGPLVLNFVVAYPPGLTGDQTFTVPVAQYRESGVTTNFTIPNIVVPPTPVPVAIATQPANQTVTSQQDATFSVVATGTPAPTYQWRKGTTNLTDGPTANGTVISGATSATLQLLHVHAADASTTYNVVVTNGVPPTPSATSNNVSLTVNKASQAITFGTLASKTFGDAAFTLSGSANSGLPVTYVSSNPSVATITGNTVTIVGGGSTTITASQSGSADYNAATDVPQTFVVNKADQTITFGQPAAKTFGDAPFALTGTSSSGLPVSYSSSIPGVATISGNTVTIVGAGTTMITVTQIGNANYNAAPSFAQPLVVNKANQSITNFTPPASLALDQSPFSLNGAATSGLALTYTVSDTGIATVSGNVLTLLHTTPAGSPITITASQPGTTNFNAATSVTATVQVLNASQTVSFAGTELAGKKFGDAPFTVTGSSNRGLLVTFTSSDPTVATVATGTLSGNNTTATVTIVGGGTTTITATQAGNSDYAAAPNVARTLTVAKIDQTIAFTPPATKTYLDVPFDLSATATSALAVSFSVVSGPATISGSTLTLTGAGSVVVRAAQGGNGNYNAAPNVDKTIVVAKAAQTITFGTLPAKTFGDADFTVSATASSNLAVSYASDNSTVATVNATSGAVHIVGGGAANITASQAGDTNYNAAAGVARALTVNKAAATVTLGSNTFTYNGSVKGATASTVPAGLTLAFTYTGTSSSTTAPTNAGTYGVTATVVDNNYQGFATGNVVINKGDQTITFNLAASVALDQSPVALIATASSGLPVTFSSSDTNVATVSGTALTLLHSSPTTPITITAKQAGDSNWNAAPDVLKSLLVLNASQTVTFAGTELAGKKFGDTPFTITGSSNRGLLITFTSSNPAAATVATGTLTGNNTTATVTIVGAGTTTITATQAGNTDFAAAPDVARTLTVAKADQVITFAPPAAKVYLDAPFDLVAATTASGLTVSFSVVSGPATLAGNTLTLTGAGNVVVRASQAGSANYNAAVNVDKTIVVAKATQTITGLPASQTKLRDAGTFALGATANSGLTVSYTSSNPAAVTVSGANGTVAGLGITTITASQAGDANYSAATNVTGTITVNPVAPIIVSTPPTTITAVQNSLFPVFGPITLNPFSDPVIFTMTGAPAGLVVNPTSGNISGTPTAAPGPYTITLTATNATGANSKTINLTLQPPAPTITSAAAVSGIAGTTYNAGSPLYTVAATNATTVTVTGLPSGLSLDTTNATAPKIIGTLTQAGNFTATITATNSANVSATLNLAISFTLPANAPVYSGTLTPSGTVGSAFTFTPNFGTGTTAYTLSGTLPAGITQAGNFASTGTLSGTPTAAAAGSYSISITALRSGVTATANLTITINPAPNAPSIGFPTGGNSRIGTAGTAITSIQLTANPASPTPTFAVAAPTIGAVGLPPGITMTSAGLISGTPTTPGTYVAQITATNTTGTGPIATLQFTVNPSATAPVITSAAVVQGRVGQTFNYTLTSSPTNNGTTTFTKSADALPAGLTFDGNTGTITGTPATGSTGSYVVYFAGTNTSGLGAALDITFNILPPLTVPVVNSNGSASGQVGQPFSYLITATNNPTSFNASGLPAGLTLGAGGAISGVPSTATNGTPVNVTLTAANADGTSSPKTLAITIDSAPATPVITSGSTATGRVSVAFTGYTISATNSPTSFAATNLPSGLSVNPTTGAITGTPQSAGTVTASIAAANAGGLGASAPLTFTIAAALTAPSITSSASASGQVNVAFTPYQIVASPGQITSYALASGSAALPAGLSLNSVTGAITGSPTVAGTTTVSLIATSDGGTSLPQPLTITIQSAVGVPVITSGGSVAVTAGVAMAPYTITATNMPTAPYPSGQGLDAVNLPAGLAANPATGVISGTAMTAETKTASMYGINSSGQGPFKDLVVTVNPPLAAPVVGGVGSVTAQVGTNFNYQIVATNTDSANAPVSYEVIGAPAWMTINGSTGALGGTPTAPGALNVSLRVTNSSGTSNPKPLAISIAAAAGTPTITSSVTPASGTVGVPITPYQMLAQSTPPAAITGYFASGLPSGLTVNASGLISGTPLVAGTYPIALSASNATGIGGAFVITLIIAPNASLVP